MAQDNAVDPVVAALTGLGPTRQDFAQLRGSAQDLSRVAASEAAKIEARTQEFDEASTNAQKALMESARLSEEESARDAAVLQDYETNAIQMERELLASAQAKSALLSDLYANREVMAEKRPNFFTNPIAALTFDDRREIARKRASLAMVRLAEQDMVEQSLLQGYKTTQEYLERSKPVAVQAAANRAGVQMQAAESAKTLLQATETSARVRVGAAQTSVQAAETNLTSRLRELEVETQRLQLPLELAERRQNIAIRAIQLEQLKGEWQDEKQRNETYDVLAKQFGTTRGVVAGLARDPQTAQELLWYSIGKSPGLPTTSDAVARLENFSPIFAGNFRYFEQLAPVASQIAETKRDQLGRLEPQTFSIYTPADPNKPGAPRTLTEFGAAATGLRDQVLGSLTNTNVMTDFLSSDIGAMELARNPVARKYEQMVRAGVQGKFSADLLLDAGSPDEVYSFMQTASRYVEKNLGLSIYGAVDPLPFQFTVTAPARGAFGIGQSSVEIEQPIETVEDLINAVQRKRNARRAKLTEPQLREAFQRGLGAAP